MYPASDGLLVALQGAARGLLRTPIQLVQQAPDVIDVAGGVRIEALQRGKTLTAGDVFGCLQHKGKRLPIDRLTAPVKLGKKDFR